MKLGAIIILTGLVIFLGFQIYAFLGRERDARKTYTDYQVKLDRANLDLKKLQDELQYYENRANVEKTLRGEFNYKAPGEKLMIIVPKAASSTGN